MRAADEAAGVIVNGRYINNPTARNLAGIVTDSGKVGGKQMSGQFMYVVDDAGDIIIGTRAGQRMPHPTLVGGANPQVRAAGIVDIRGGRIYSIDMHLGTSSPALGLWPRRKRRSGGYCPTARSTNTSKDTCHGTDKFNEMGIVSVVPRTRGINDSS